MKRLFLSAIFAFCVFGSIIEAAAPASTVKSKIAQKIWQNECAGSVQGLVSWNKGEDFPSLGIGHFIWFPAGVKANFEESFPEFVRFAKRKGVKVPAFFDGAAPWKTRAEWAKADVKGGLASQMRAWLANHTELQADFIIARSLTALERIKKQSSSPQELATRYYAVAQTPNGMYALIDYVNFKGEGINPKERYQGKGWGLMQVLEEMRSAKPGAAAAKEFSEASKRVLSRRVQLSPPSRGESRWLKGWHNRCDTYAKPI